MEPRRHTFSIRKLGIWMSVIDALYQLGILLTFLVAMVQPGVTFTLAPNVYLGLMAGLLGYEGLCLLVLAGAAVRHRYTIKHETDQLTKVTLNYPSKYFLIQFAICFFISLIGLIMIIVYENLRGVGTPVFASTNTDDMNTSFIMYRNLITWQMAMCMLCIAFHARGLHEKDLLLVTSSAVVNSFYRTNNHYVNPRTMFST